MELLINKAKSNDVESFIELMERNKTSMYKVAKSILKNDEDVADAMQETILACYKNIEKLESSSYFKTWITRILINKCNDIIRTQKKYANVIDLIEEGYIENTDEIVIIKECFEKLGMDYKIVMQLYYQEGFNSREISEILNTNESTIKTRLSRGRKYFKNLYMENSKGGCING